MSALSTSATRIRSTENRRRPSWKSVCGWLVPQVVRDPSELGPASGRDDDGLGRPAATTVPMRAQLGRSETRVASGRAAVALVTAVDSPVIIDSSHSGPWTSSNRTSAGTTWPSCSRTRSPGTSAVTSTSAGATADDGGGVADPVVEGRRRALGAVLVAEAQRDAHDRDDADDGGVRGVAEEGGRDGRSGEEEQQRAPFNCRPRTRRAVARCSRTAFGPNRANRSATSDASRPSRGLPRDARTSSGVSLAASMSPGPSGRVQLPDRVIYSASAPVCPLRRAMGSDRFDVLACVLALTITSGRICRSSPPWHPECSPRGTPAMPGDPPGSSMLNTGSVLTRH